MRLFPVASFVFVAVAVVSVVLAEGVEPEGRGKSHEKRIYGASSLKPLAGGVASVGGSSLRYLAPGARQWRSLHRRQGNLSRLGVEPASDRLLAVWEHDTVLHYFRLGNQHHAQLPLPTMPPPAGARLFYVGSLAFAPNGRDALIYMEGPTGNSGQGRASRAFRAKLDSPGEPELLFEVPRGMPLWTSPRGVVYDLPESKRECYGCLENGLYAFDITNGELVKRRFFGAPQPVFRQAKVVAGSDPERLVMFILTGRGTHSILKYRWGDDQALYQDLPPGAGPSRGIVAPNADEVVYVVEGDVELDIVRRALPPASTSTSTRLWLPWKLVGEGRAQPIYGMGVRPNGTAWLHFGDEMALVDATGVARRTSVRAFVRDQPVEWAGADLYIEKPEGLWIGVEVGPGRDFVWVSFTDLEARATPWPVRDPSVPLPRAEQRERHNKCLPPETRIATPAGEVAVDELEEGMPVWTQDRAGRRIEGTVIAKSRARVGGAHALVRLRLADGRSVSVSAGHPVLGGRGVEELRPGEAYDGAPVDDATLIPYAGSFTYDLLPSGPSGAYWANGIPLASTLTNRFR